MASEQKQLINRSFRGAEVMKEKISIFKVIERFKAEYLEKIAQFKGDDAKALDFLLDEVAYANAACTCLKSDYEELRNLVIDISLKQKDHISEVNKKFKNKNKRWF